MKSYAFGGLLLMGLPGVFQAQTGVRVSVPAVRVSVGPLSPQHLVGAGKRRGAGRARGRRSRQRRRARVGLCGSGAGHRRALHRYPVSVWRRKPSSGFDCSGFVHYIYARHGIDLPRTSRGQATAGSKVSGGAAALRPGDLMLFASTGGRIDHVAIYAGQGRMIHSSASAKGVGYDDLSSARGRWFMERHVASRRVL